MKKKIILSLTILIVLGFCFVTTNLETNTYEVKSIMYQEGGEDAKLKAGTYTSSDGHTITIASDRTVLYDGTYKLTISENAKGSTLTGKIGTNKKSVTFYQLNNSKIVSGAVMDYTHGGTTVYLYDYTVFSMDSTPTEDATGSIELWRNDSKINTYSDLQSIIDAAQNGDTIKLTKDLNLTGGAYIKNKTINLEGNGYTINSETWLNSIFVVEEDATLNVNNITIDGKATGYEVDHSSINIQTGTSTKIPLKTGSDSSDPKRNISVFISKGNLTMTQSNFNNNYGVSGSVINIVSGNLTLKNSKFDHNRSTTGGSVYIGSNFKVGQTDYSINEVLIKDCEFISNYSNNGGALYMYNVDNFDILNSKFIKNTVTGGKGGAILINNQSKRVSTQYNLDFPSALVDNCLFEENWVGNDGAAIENHEAAMVIKNTIFRKNVGIHSTSSCGTVSYSVSEVKQVPQIIENCLFEENMGAASTLADHATYVKLDVINTKFVSNKATHNSMLLYSSNATFTNCLFENEYVARTIVDLNSYDKVYYDNIPRKVIFKDVVFKNTQQNVTDILVRKLNDENDFTTTVILEGNTNAKVDVWQNNELIVKGNFEGTINTDNLTLAENIKVEESATVKGKINNGANKNKVTLVFYEKNKVEGYNWEIRRYIYSENKTYTEEEFFLEHFITEDGYKLKYYTDPTYTTEWDYIVSAPITLYGQWEEHTHAFTGNLTLYENAIHEQCECGYLGKKIELKAPKDLTNDGKEKEIIVENEIGISTSDYKVTYQKLNKNGKWEYYQGVPENEGTYKAILSYKNMNIEQEYSIEKKKEENTTIKNPETGDNIEKSFILLIISSFLIIITICNYKNKTQKN